MHGKIKRFIQLLKEKKDLAKRTKEVNEALDWIEPEIRLHFADQGIEKITKDGMTIFIRRQLFARKCEIDDLPVSDQACIEALKAAGMENFYEQKMKQGALNAYFKELEEEELPIPDALQGKLRPQEIFKVTGRVA